MPAGTDITAIRKEYPDIVLDDEGTDGQDSYFVGKSSDEEPEEGEREWLDHDEAVECCGFVEGACPEASTMIEGNGGWAQGMISRKDFSTLAIDDKAKRDYKNTSNRYWRAHARGKAAVTPTPPYSFNVGDTITVIPSSLPNGPAEVVKVGRKNLCLRPLKDQVTGPEWIIAYKNWKGTRIEDDLYSVPLFHCRPKS